MAVNQREIVRKSQKKLIVGNRSYFASREAYLVKCQGVRFVLPIAYAHGSDFGFLWASM